MAYPATDLVFVADGIGKALFFKRLKLMTFCSKVKRHSDPY